MKKLSHIDSKGKAVMVDVSSKRITRRSAIAAATVTMRSDTLSLLLSGKVPKGDVLAAARIAGIMAAKKTSSIIPLCHPLDLTSVTVDFDIDEKKSEVHIRAESACSARTGVEMEAMTAAAVSALTIYDMCKAVDRDITISKIMLLEKKGGKSGRYIRKKS
ncbi:MAG: cyclic pyranopterin monophosphate synthase MoaC [Nitrospirota bacterium]|nr:MAG: cyclic pyranopterin monophosphate synthase MoaC [Nitrospirota bacterium]